MLHFELTGNEEKIQSGILPFIKQILNEDIPEKIIVGLMCIREVFEISDRKLYEIFNEIKERILQISSKYLLFVQGALIETSTNNINKECTFNFQQKDSNFQKNPLQLKEAC